MRLDQENLRRKFQNATPLEMGNLLLEQELYDEREALEIIEEIDRELKGQEDVIDKVVVPIFYNIADNVVNKNSTIRRMGVTPGRIIEECKHFGYEGHGVKHAQAYKENDIVDSIQDRETRVDENYKNGGRERFEDKKKLDRYKKEQANNGANKTVEDEYEGGRIYVKKNDRDDRNFKDPTHHMANTDHIVPVKAKVVELRKNIALSDADIKEIVNIDANFAMTNEALNKSKRDSTNSDYVKENKDTLDTNTAKVMLEKEKSAEKVMTKKQNEKVIHNFKNKDERQRITEEMAFISGKDAMSSVRSEAIGDILMNIIKVTYYEITDIFKNGITHGTGTSSKIDAFKYRMKRGIRYVMSQLGKAQESISKFVKAFVSNVFEMLISFVAGGFKCALQILKRGFSSLMQAFKVLVQPNSVCTPAEKADAIVKIGVTAATMIAGEALEPMVEKVVGPQLAIVVTPLITGIISTVIVYTLDKLDLFGSSIEVKRRRVKEVFEARIEDIQENVKAFDTLGLQILCEQKQKFDDLTQGIYQMLDNNNTDGLLAASFETAEFFGVELGYSDTEGFIQKVKSQEVIEM